MMGLLSLYLQAAFAIGFIASLMIAIFYCADDSNLPVEQCWAAGIAIFVLSPLLVPALVGFGLYKAVPLLLCGFRDLWRSLFPKLVKLPKAKVRRG